MNNKQTLQSYNTNLGENNETLTSILNVINKLPEAGSGEDVSEELTTQDTKLTTQETTIDDIIVALKNKGLPTPDIEPDYIQDGLVAWWEGCDDVDENGYWRSRVGDDYISQVFDKVMNSTGQVNRFYYSKTKDGYINAMSWNLVTQQDYYQTGYTVEVVGSVGTTATPDSTLTGTSGGSLITFNKSCSPMIQIYGSKQRFFPLNWDSGNINNHTYKRYENCINKLYKYAINLDTIVPRGVNSGYSKILFTLNGDDWSEREANLSNMPNTTPNMLIMCYYDRKYQSNAEVKSIRVYNRKLTHEELVHNYEIDKKRFDLDEYEEA